MPAIVTIQHIKDLVPEAESVADNIIQNYIDLVEQAETCLTTSNAPDATKLFLKSNAVAHYIVKSMGGTVKSERDMDGASVTFDTYKTDGYGLSSTMFGQNILNNQYCSCFSFIDRMPNRFIQSFGR